MWSPHWRAWCISIETPCPYGRDFNPARDREHEGWLQQRRGSRVPFPSCQLLPRCLLMHRTPAPKTTELKVTKKRIQNNTSALWVPTRDMTWYPPVTNTCPFKWKALGPLSPLGKPFIYTTSGEFDQSGFPPRQLSAFPPLVFWRQKDLRAR